jgi:hypothetical protein
MSSLKIASRVAVAVIISTAGWAQTQVQPPTSTRPQSPSQSSSSPATRKDAPGQTGASAVPQSSGGGQIAAGPQTATVAMTILDRVQKAAQAANADLDRIRIDKWKTDSGQKQQMQQVAQSLTRNLQSAVPELVQKARAAQTSVAAQFKLYHDLSVVYEFYSSLAEAAGAFAPKQEYEPLAQDAAALDQARQSLSDYIQNLATQNDSELVKLRAAAQQQAQAAQQQQQKKVIVDDQQSPKKKSTTKKKSSSTTKKNPQ